MFKLILGKLEKEKIKLILDYSFYNFVLKYTCLISDLVKIIINYVNDIIELEYKIIRNVINIFSKNNYILFEKYNFDYSIFKYDKLHRFDIVSALNFENISQQYVLMLDGKRIGRLPISIVSFINYFMKDNSKNDFLGNNVSGLVDTTWRKNNNEYMEDDNGDIYYPHVFLVKNSNKLKNIFVIMKFLMTVIFEIY